MSNLTLIRNFRSAIRRGTGEAHLLITKHPNVDFSNEIIKACLKNFAYDGQCESRAYYLFELLKQSKYKKIRLKILAALATERSDTWSLTQLFELAKLFAMQGDIEAKDAIYARFYTELIDGSDWAGSTEIIDIDGWEGLLFITDKVGRALKDGLDIWQDDMMIDYYSRKHPDTDVMAALKEASQSNPYIKAYLDSVEQTLNDRTNRNERTYSNIVQEILLKKSRFMRKDVSDKELNLIAQRLMLETDRISKEKLLFVFTRFKFPFDHQFILKIAQGKSEKNKKLARLALLALRLIPHPDIRAFLIAELSTTKEPESVLRLLKSNYNKGDEKMLTYYATLATKEEDVEWFAICYIDIFETNNTPECKEPLEIIYNKLTCGIHRYDVVKILMLNDVLSDRIKEEVKFDCNKKTRQLVLN